MFSLRILVASLFPLILVFIVLVLASCASKVVNTSQPDWVTGDSKKYTSEQYMIGVGEADTMSTAKSRARAEIAKIFSVAVEATMTDSSSFANDGLGSTQNSLAIDRELKSKTNQLLQGVELPKVWRDETSQRFFALAVLPRQKARLALSNDIDQLDLGIDSRLNRSRESTYLFEKMKLMATAIDLKAQRDRVNAQLRVVSLLGNGKPSNLSIESLKSEYAQLLSQVTITPEATGVGADQLQRSLSDALANQGYKVTEQGGYHVSAHLNSTALPPREGWHYQKGVLLISVMGEGKISLGGNQWNFKVSARDAELAKIRVMEKARQLMNEELNEKLLTILSSN